MSKKTTKKVVAKVATKRVARFDDAKRIVILPAGKTNPRRKGTGPFNRYNVLLRSRTVGAFLKSQPKWHSTIVRAVKEKLIRVA